MQLVWAVGIICLLCHYRFQYLNRVPSLDLHRAIAMDWNSCKVLRCHPHVVYRVRIMTSRCVEMSWLSLMLLLNLLTTRRHLLNRRLVGRRLLLLGRVRGDLLSQLGYDNPYTRHSYTSSLHHRRDRVPRRLEKPLRLNSYSEPTLVPPLVRRGHLVLAKHEMNRLVFETLGFLKNLVPRLSKTRILCTDLLLNLGQLLATLLDFRLPRFLVLWSYRIREEGSERGRCFGQSL